VVSDAKGADFLQLERRGNVLTMSVARFGELLSVSRLDDLPLGDDVYVGLFLCSHNVDVVEKAIFKDVRVIRPAKVGFTPYRDYIGSVLEILDVETGRRQVVHRSAEPFEAPNWTTDGKALLYNSSGAARAAAGSTASTSPRASRRSSTPASRSATTTTTCSRSTARCSGSATRARTSGARPSTCCRRRAARRRDHAAHAVVPARLVARRQDARLHGGRERRVRHLRSRRTAAGRRST
jgi:hypothetical protein